MCIRDSNTTQPRCVDGPQEQRLRELDPSQSSFLDARGSRGQQSSGDMEAAVRMPREAKAPVGQGVAADGQHRHEDDEHGHPLYDVQPDRVSLKVAKTTPDRSHICLLYTSDAA